MSEGAVEATPEAAQASLPGTTSVDSPAEATVTTIPSEPVSWRDGLSDDLRAHPSLKNFQDVGGLAKSYVSQSELVGRKGVILPNENDAADQARFYGELGRPESVDGYDLGDFAPSEGLSWSDDLQVSMLGSMHELGLTNDQVNGVIRAYAEGQTSQLDEFNQSVDQSNTSVEQELRREYGNTYDAKIDLGNRAFALAAGDQMDDVRQIVLADGTMLGNNKPFIKLFTKLGESLGEDSLRGSGSPQSFSKSPEQAQGELSQLAIDESFQKILMDASHPEHERVVQRRADLYEQAYPNTETTGSF